MLREWLVDAFGPEDADRVYAHCTRGRGEPLGASHFSVAEELADVELDSSIARPLDVAYMLLTAYYFLLDSATDGHPDDPVLLSDLTLLLSGVWVALRQAGDNLKKEQVDEMVRLCLSRMGENAAAIRGEAEQIGSWQGRDERASRRSSVGRSNSALLLYELVCVAGGRRRDPEVLQILEEYLALIQESDDLDDWRDDLDAGRWTPFLKRCAEAAGGEDGQEAIVRVVYLEGGYERQAAIVIRRLRDATHRLAQRLERRPSLVLRCWTMQGEVRERALSDWIATKLRYQQVEAR
jgi:hypothetical protein